MITIAPYITFHPHLKNVLALPDPYLLNFAFDLSLLRARGLSLGLGEAGIGLCSSFGGSSTPSHVGSISSTFVSCWGKHPCRTLGKGLLTVCCCCSSSSTKELTHLSTPLSSPPLVSASSEWTGVGSAVDGLLSLPPISMSLGTMSSSQLLLCWYHVTSSTWKPPSCLNIGMTNLSGGCDALPLLVWLRPGASMNMSARGARSHLSRLASLPMIGWTSTCGCTRKGFWGGGGESSGMEMS